MAATRNDIETWFDQGVELGATHMLVVCDDFDYEDYPVYVQPGESVTETIAEKTGTNMQRLMEVYKLSADKAAQLAEHRAMNLT